MTLLYCIVIFLLRMVSELKYPSDIFYSVKTIRILFGNSFTGFIKTVKEHIYSNIPKLIKLVYGIPNEFVLFNILIALVAVFKHHLRSFHALQTSQFSNMIVADQSQSKWCLFQIHPLYIISIAH